MSVSIEKLVKAYIKIRDKRSELSTKFKEEDDVLSKKVNKIKSALLEHCKEHNAESVRTSEGIFFRSVKQRYWTSDWENMFKFIREHDVPELFEKRLNQTNVRQFLTENPDIIPKGLNVDSEYTVSVRKK